MSSPVRSGMWGGVFEKPPDSDFYEFQRSWRFDRRLLPYELVLDRAWARALTGAGILSEEECLQILESLHRIECRAHDEPGWLESSPAEDVHDFVESALTENLGSLGARLHTGRSRNEMISTEFRMYLRAAAIELRRGILALERAIVIQASSNFGVLMPGATHLQHAQPILLSHWLLAHGEAFHRDFERVGIAAGRAGDCPLGSGALAGCPFPIQREALAADLGFSRPTPNSLDAVGDRDFAAEFAFALSLLAMHLSRLAEDLVLFASPEFGYVVLPDDFSTGSSLMPQKKNPDVWELIRGKTGRIYGALVAILTTCKGLPSGYQRDLQEDKEPIFGALDQVLAILRVAPSALQACRFEAARLTAGASDPALLATEIADYLVRAGVPFRQAHEITGRILQVARRQNVNALLLPLDLLREFSPAFQQGWQSAVSVESAISRKNVPGGTAPAAVRSALDAFLDRLERAGGEL
jgi:argininosuccinate lyase